MIPDFTELFSDLPDLFGIVYAVYTLVMFVVSIGTYVFQSLGFYTIAKRRGIRNPWLSWLPVGNLWILGCISDQYQYVAKGKIKNKRKSLLVLDLLMLISAVALVVLYTVAIIGLIGGAMDAEGFEYMDQSAIAMLLAVIAIALAVCGMSIAATIITYFALYDLYSSCDPKNNVLYLVLNIFVSITLPIFVFICRNKDLGMPPRKTEQPTFIPQAEPQESWNPVDSEPEPWDHNAE